MSSPTDRIYDPGDPSPYAPRWVRHAPNGQRRSPARGQIGHDNDDPAAGEELEGAIARSEPIAPPLAAAAPVAHDDELLIDEFRVPRSLDPGVVPDPWPARGARLGGPRVFGMLGRLALAGSAAAVVALVAVGKLSLPATTGAAEQANNLMTFGSRFAGPAAKPQDQPGIAERAVEPRQQLALAGAGPAMPVTASAPAPALPLPAAIVAPAAPEPAPVVTTLDPDSEEVAALVKRGQELAASGDVAAARLTLRRAAEAHNARAALAFAATYDPIVLETLGIYGVAPDIATARSWYEKAREYGSAEAPRRLEMLVSRER
jgi:hypothetical protein